MTMNSGGHRSRGNKNRLIGILAIALIALAVVYFANTDPQRSTTFGPGGDQSSQGPGTGSSKAPGTGQ